MNIEHLKLFIRIAACHNISLAGKELGLSPAVASSHINKLEESLGVRLIHRTTRKVSLTEDGVAFLPHAQEVLSSVDVAFASVGSGNMSPSGRLRITAPASFGRMHLIPALNGFMAQYPDLNLDLRLSDSIVDMVEGGFDVAIRNAALNDSSLIARKIAQDTRLVCASPDYLNKHGTPKQPSDLLNHQCIDLMGLDTWTFQTNEGDQSIKIKHFLRADNGEAIRDAAINGLGLTICSQWCAYKAIQAKQLVPVLTNTPLVSNTSIWAVYPSSRLLAPKVRVFIDYLKTHFGETPYWELT